MKRQLIRIEREIVCYNSKTNEAVRYFNIDIMRFEKIKSIVLPKSGDPELFNGYILTNEQIVLFNKELNDRLKIDFQNHYYVLECTGIYE